MKNLKQFLLLALLLTSVQAFAESTAKTATTSASDMIVINDAYARAVPPGQPNSAAFMLLQNTSDADHALVNASSSVSKVVELHTHIREGEMMKMRRIEKIDIPAQGTTTLQPGGLHIMLIDLHDDLKIDQKILLTLEFEDGSNTAVEVPVRKIMMKGMQGGMKH